MNVICDQPHPDGLAELSEIVSVLGPKWQSRAIEADTNARLPDATHDELRQEKLFNLCVPKRFGGRALDWRLFSTFSSSVAASCPATAWTLGLVGGHAAMIARMTDDCQTEVFGADAQQLIATASVQRQSDITPSRAGYVVSGKWSISSGIEFADWVVLYVRHSLFGDSPHLMVMPASDVTIVDDWQVFGLRATGSKSVEVAQVEVPTHRVISQATCFGANPPGAALNPEAPYFVRPYVPYLSSAILGPVLGTTQGGLDAALDMLRPTYARMGPEDGARALMEVAVAESTAELHSAKLLVAGCHALLCTPSIGHSSVALSEAEWNQLRRDKAYAVKLCNRAMDRLAEEVGTIGIFTNTRFQLLWRDLKAMSKHMDVRWQRMSQPFGQAQLLTHSVQS